MELIVKGMTCGHCEAAVKRAVKRVDPQAEVTFERMQDLVLIAGDVDVEDGLSAIRVEGYKVSISA